MQTARPHRAATSKLATASASRSARAAPCRRFGALRCVLDRLRRRGGHAVRADLGGIDRGEHASHDRHAERASDLPRDLVHRGPVAGLLRPHVVHDHRRHRRGHRADAATDERGAEQHERGRPVGGEEQQRHEAGSRGDQTRKQDAGRPEPRDEPPTHRGEEAEPQAERGDLETRDERRAVLDVLHVLRDDEQHAERRDVRGEDHQSAGRDAPACEYAHVEQRVATAELSGQERDAGGDARDRSDEHRRARPSGVDAFDEREHDAAQRQRREGRARDVERRHPWAARLRQPAQPERNREQHERDVDEEDPAPARHVDEQTAHDGSERKPEPSDRGPDTRRLRPQLRREEHGQQRQRRRHHAGRGHAHQHPRRDQLAHRLGDRRQHGRDREAHQPQQEHPPAPEPVCEPVADE